METEVKTVTCVQSSPELTGWVEKIIIHHAQVEHHEGYVRSHKLHSLEHALLCGEYLSKCKAAIPYGTFGVFVKQYLSGVFSARTGRRYVSLYKGRDKLIGGVASLRAAFIQLGIISDKPALVDRPIDDQPDTEVFARGHSKDEDEASKEVEPTSPELSQEEKAPRVKTPIRMGDELVLLYKPSTYDYKRCEKPFVELHFQLNGKFHGINPDTQKRVRLTKTFMDRVFQTLTPFFRWYQKELEKRAALVDAKLAA